MKMKRPSAMNQTQTMQLRLERWTSPMGPLLIITDGLSQLEIFDGTYFKEKKPHNIKTKYKAPAIRAVCLGEFIKYFSLMG